MLDIKVVRYVVITYDYGGTDTIHVLRNKDVDMLYGHIAKGNKVNAIRDLRQLTRCSLYEGKHIVDHIASIGVRND